MSDAAFNFSGRVGPEGYATMMALNAVGQTAQQIAMLTNTAVSTVCRTLQRSEPPSADMKGMKRCWTKKGMKPLRLTRDQGSPRVMLWGCIGLGGFRKLIVMHEYLNEETYTRLILQPNSAWLTNGQHILQEDNATAHTGKVPTAWLRSHKVRTLESEFGVSWPARSPDLSPVEHVWQIIEHRVHVKHHPMTAEEVTLAWQMEMDLLETDVIDKLVISFVGKLKRCRELRGAPL